MDRLKHDPDFEQIAKQHNLQSSMDRLKLTLREVTDECIFDLQSSMDRLKLFVPELHKDRESIYNPVWID